MREKKRTVWVSVTEGLFLAVLGLYLVYLTLDSTTFDTIFTKTTERGLLIALGITAGLKLLANWVFNPEQRREMWMLLPAACMGVIWLLVYRGDGYSFLPFLAIVTVGCVGTDYRKPLRVAVAATGFTVIAAILCALAGVIPNLVYTSDITIRSSWGIVYPTDFSSHLVMLCIMAWIAWPDLHPAWFLIPGGFSLFVSWYIAYSLTGMLCSALFLLLVMLDWLFRQCPAARPVQWLQKLARSISVAAFPAFAVITVGLMLAYRTGNPLAARIDSLMHHHFQHAASALDAYGIHPFGVTIPLVGNGGTVITRADYNFIDCSYLLTLLRYGAVTLVVLTLIWPWGTRKAQRSGHERLALGLALVAFHAVSEHHLLELDFNPLIALLFARIPIRNAEQEETAPIRKHAWMASLIPVVLLVGLVICFPGLLSRFATLCGYFRLGSTAKRQTFLLGAILAGLSAVALLCWLLGKLAKAKQESRPMPRLAALASLVLLAGCIAVGFTGEHFLRKAQAENASLLEQERPAMEALQQIPGLTVQSDVLPELYHSTYPRISRGIWQGNDHARQEHIAVIAGNREEQTLLTQRAFLYAEISPKHAIYTNDPQAQEALRSAGYHLTGYFSSSVEVDLPQLAITANRTYNGEGILLTAKKPLKRGPYPDLTGGYYTVTYDLSVDPALLQAQQEDAVLCTLQINGRKGKDVIAELPVSASSFDETGKASIPFYLYLPATHYTGFYLYPAENTRIQLNGLRYQRTPTYDVHTEYDHRWRRARESYYDHEGNLTVTPSGYTFVSYQYADDEKMWWQPSITSYYNIDNQPMLISNCYFSIYREYWNNTHLALREEYWGFNGELVPGPSGYAITERIYIPNTWNVLEQHLYDVDGNEIFPDS